MRFSSCFDIGLSYSLNLESQVFFKLVSWFIFVNFLTNGKGFEVTTLCDGSFMMLDARINSMKYQASCIAW